MAWTVPADVTSAWIGEDVPTDLALVQVWLGKAEREIRFRVPDIQARIDAQAALVPPSTDLLDAAKDVAVSMVMRVFRNPDGIRQRNTTTGPFTESATYGGDQPGALALTADEFAKLQAVQSSGAFSVNMIPTTSRFHPDYVAPAW